MKLPKFLPQMFDEYGENPLDFDLSAVLDAALDEWKSLGRFAYQMHMKLWERQAYGI